MFEKIIEIIDRRDRNKRFF